MRAEHAGRLGQNLSELPSASAFVYCSLDPATPILEIAVHTGFEALDTVPHVITAARIADIAEVHVVQRDDAPNANWLVPGTPSAGQQAFGG